MPGDLRIASGPGGRPVPLRGVETPGEVGRALRPGVLVEVSAETAAACGAWVEDCLEAEEALAAAEHPAAFGDEPGGGGRAE